MVIQYIKQSDRLPLINCFDHINQIVIETYIQIEPWCFQTLTQIPSDQKFKKVTITRLQTNISMKYCYTTVH